MEGRVLSGGRIVAVQSKEEARAVKKRAYDEVVIDALKTKIKVLDEEILHAHETIEELEKERKLVQEKLQSIINE